MDAANAGRPIGADLLAQRHVHRQMQKRVRTTALRTEVRLQRGIALFQPQVILRVLADDGGKLRLEWREHGTRTGLLPGLQPAAAQFVTRATEQQTHESARVLWRKAQRSAMPHAGQAGLRALHT